MIEVAAIIASLLLLGLVVFQILLIAGRPIGNLAWGGQHKVLPAKMRIASMASVALFLFFSLIILDQAGVITVFNRSGWSNTVMLLLTVYFFIGIVMNAVSRSKPERLVMTPVAATLALLFLYVLISVK